MTGYRQRRKHRTLFKVVPLIDDERYINLSHWAAGVKQFCCSFRLKLCKAADQTDFSRERAGGNSEMLSHKVEA